MNNEVHVDKTNSHSPFEIKHSG